MPKPLRSRQENRAAALLWLILPLAALGLAIAWLLITDPLRSFGNGAPPVENLTFERTILSSDGIRVLVRAGGSEPMTIAQVQVDDAYWQFTQEPTGPLARGATAWIHLPFPWVLGEAHAINIVTNTGATFEHEIAVAVPTPTRDATSLRAAGVARHIRRPCSRRHRNDVLSRAARRRPRRHEFPACPDRRPAGVPSRRCHGRGIRTCRRVGRAVPGTGHGRARGRGKLPSADGGRAPRRRADRACARHLHRARHRPAQSRRGTGHRRSVRGGRGGLGHVPGAGFHGPQRHRRHRHFRADAESAAASCGPSPDWRCWRAVPRSSACGSEASPTRRNGRRWRWRSVPEPSSRSSSRSLPI